jgi:uncharacterized membrane protein YeaQ/YmgE (transglycosylase-associated protein family)
MIIWLLIGLAAGAIAKMLTPQKEKGGWISSLIIGVIGSIVGGWLAGIIGADHWFGRGWIGDLIIAVGGAFLVLFIYHRFLADKLKLPL